MSEIDLSGVKPHILAQRLKERITPKKKKLWPMCEICNKRRSSRGSYGQCKVCIRLYSKPLNEVKRQVCPHCKKQYTKNRYRCTYCLDILDIDTDIIY